MVGTGKGDLEYEGRYRRGRKWRSGYGKRRRGGGGIGMYPSANSGMTEQGEGNCCGHATGCGDDKFVVSSAWTGTTSVTGTLYSSSSGAEPEFDCNSSGHGGEGRRDSDILVIEIGVGFMIKRTTRSI